VVGVNDTHRFLFEIFRVLFMLDLTIFVRMILFDLALKGPLDLLSRAALLNL